MDGNVCGCVPVVVRFLHHGNIVVGVKSPPWGFGSKLKECLNEHSAERYQQKLWAELRALAWAEHDRRNRQRELVMRERIARASGAL
jgi:hypothetical protein